MPRIGEVLTLKELSARTGVSTRRIKKLVEQGHVAPVRIHGAGKAVLLFSLQAVKDVESVVDDEPPAYMNATEASKYLGYSRQGFYNLAAKAGIVPLDIIGSHPVYSLAEVEEIATYAHKLPKRKPQASAAADGEQDSE